MIEIHPMTNLKRQEELLSQVANTDANSRILMMTERGIELGYVCLCVVDTKLVIYKFDLFYEIDFDNLNEEQEFFVDTLMRSAASFGETNGACFIETINANYNKVLAKKGFTTSPTRAFTPMSTIVHYTD